MAIFGLFKKDKSKASIASSSSIAADDDTSSNDPQLRPRRSFALLTPRKLDDGYASSTASFVSATPAKKPRRLPFTKKTPLANQPSVSTLGDQSADVHAQPSPPTKLMLNLDSSVSSLPTRSPVFPSFHHSGSTPALSIPSPKNVQNPSRPQARPMQPKDSPSSQKSNSALFGWRERKRSKPSVPAEALTIPPLLDDSSFNLKSFRHVLPERTTDSPPPGNSPTQSLSTNSLAPPPARPRGASVVSTDSSQRISVAAFREAQARRSSTNLTSGSPSPTIRPLSVATTSSVSDLALSKQTNPPARAMTPSASPSPAPRPTSTFKSLPSKGAAVSSDTSSTEDSDSEDGSASRSCSRLSRQRTITKSYRTKSDLGHERAGAEHSHRRQGSSSHSELGHGFPSRPPRANHPSHSPARGPPPSSFQKTAEAVMGTRSHNVYKHQRASYSAHELNPTSVGQRASTMQKTSNSGISIKSPAVETDTSKSSSESESSDDDDAPLASLAQPRRPPSAMSVSTTTTNSNPRKPLINLNMKSNPFTGKPLADEKENTESARSVLISPTNINSRLSKLTAAAGLGVHQSSVASKSVENLSSNSHLRPSLLDRSQPISPSSTDTVMPPVRTTSPEPMEQSSRRASMPYVTTLQEVQRTQSSDLQPVPVRSREHQSGFRVVSRPLKPASESLSPSSSASVPTQSHHLQRPSSGARNSTSSTPSNSVPRPPSSIAPLKTQPLVLPSMESSSSASPSTSRQSVMASSSNSSGRPGVQNVPPRPLLMEARRRDSPASSTGGSSTGPAPLTPADGSDYFSPGVRGDGDSPGSNSIRSTPQSAMKGGRGHLKRASVSFQDNIPELDYDATVRGRKSSHSLAKPDNLSVEERENRRRDRRRSEAKAAIELGNVVNGKGPQIADDDDDDDFLPNSNSPQTVIPSNVGGYPGQMPMGWPSQAMPQQPMMTGMSNMNMMGAPVMGVNMLSPQQFMITPPPPNADLAYLAAHQQAMLVAKQAYQYAVAQQAMQAAGEEWERGSSVSGFASSNAMGATAMPGYVMNTMWNSSTPMFPPAPRSMYAGSIYGGPSDGNWGTASVYGESFGPANQRTSRINAHKRNSSGAALGGMAGVSNAFPRGDSTGNVPQTTFSSPATARPGPRPRVKTAPSNANLPSQHRNSQMPPSSWKVNS